MKYIMLETSNGAKLPVIFPTTLNHVDVATLMGVLLERRQEVSSECVSAGFVELGDNVTVHGESESLSGLQSRPTDAMRIMIGDAVSYTPDSLMQMLMATAQEETKPLTVRSLAVEIVDGIHGYTYEFSSHPSQHQDEYDYIEKKLGDLVAQEKSK